MPKRTTLVPARLAIKYGYELVPTQIERLSGAHFLTTFHQPLKPDPNIKTEQGQAIEMTARISAMFQDWVRQAPAEWLCSKRLWNKDQQPLSDSLVIPQEA